MRAKEYLSQVRLLEARIRCKTDDATRLRELATRITPILRDDGGASGGGNSDRLGDTVARLLDLQDDISRDVVALTAKKRAVSERLDMLTDRRYYTVLYRRYLLYETFDQIALGIGCSWRHACNLHGWALKAFQQVLDRVEKEGMV